MSHVLGDHDFSKCFMFVRFGITKSMSANEEGKKDTLVRFPLPTSVDPHEGQKKKARALRYVSIMLVCS